MNPLKTLASARPSEKWAQDLNESIRVEVLLKKKTEEDLYEKNNEVVGVVDKAFERSKV